MNMKTEATLTKPKLRGYFHQEAFFFASGAGILLVAHAQTGLAQFAFSIYAICLAALFGISAAYHRFHWSPPARKVMKRLDHSAIFLLIAGTMTPFALLAVPSSISTKLLVLIWLVAAFGILQSVFWIGAPKWFSAILYIVAGWMLYPYIDLLRVSIGSTSVILLIVGGCLYSLGAVFYALKSPRLYPDVFGYHELFHALTIAAAAAHFAAVYRLAS